MATLKQLSSVSLRRTLANEFVPVLIVGNRQQFVIRDVGSEIRRYLHIGVIHVRHFFYDGVVVDSLYFEQNVPVFVERRDIAFALQKSEDILPDALLGEERGNRAENQEQGERKFLHADSFFWGFAIVKDNEFRRMVERNRTKFVRVWVPPNNVCCFGNRTAFCRSFAPRTSGAALGDGADRKFFVCGDRCCA